MPVANGRKYRLSFDYKINTLGSGTHRLYIALRPYDSSKSMIKINTTKKPLGSNCDTTLAADLKSGDTTVTLTSGTNWPTNRTYQRVGICNVLAWGYNRCSASYSYSSISGNVITLKSAYSGSTIPSGTKVSEFEYDLTYYYPWEIQFTTTSDWQHV